MLNANAISASGNSSGVPQTNVSGLGALSAAPTSSTSKVGEDSARAMATSALVSNDVPRILLLTVDVLGFGDCDSKDSNGKCN